MKHHHMRLNRSPGGDVAIYIVLILFGFFMVLPLVYAISTSLKPLNEIWIFPPRYFVRNPTTQNFKTLFALLEESQVPLSRYVFNTVFISVVGTAGHVIVSSLCAYALAKHHFRGKNVLFNIVVLSLMFTGSVTALPNYIIMTKLHLIDTYAALILPAVAAPLGLYLMKQFMEQMVPDAILEAAKLDGAGELYMFRKIVMPMVKPAWLTLIILSFQGLWGTGQTNFIYTEQLKTLNYALSQILAGGLVRAGAGAAAAVIMMIVPIGTFIITQSNIIETFSSSGIKE